MSVAVVTGASTGIGRAIARALAHDGHAVVLNSRQDVAGGQETVQLIERAGGAATYCCADVSTLAGAEMVFAHADASLGAPTILVNNAGATRGAEFGAWTERHWHDMLDTNLLTAALMSQAFATRLPAGASGAIVNVASIRGIPNATRIGIAAYCAAKAGVIALTTALARALAPAVTVNAVSPGFVETAYMARADERMKAAWLDNMPIDRFIEPEEVGALVASLIRQPALTGSNVVIDGAWTITAD